MRRYQAQQQRKKRRRLLLILPIVVVMIAAAAVMASGATFTASSANPNNTFTAGNLSHSNSKAGSAILTASKMKPGDSVTGSVTITNDGDLPGTFTLSTSSLAETAVGTGGGHLADVLQLKIMDGTTQIYNESIKSVGTITLGTWAAGAAHTYDFTVTFPDGGTPGSNSTGDNIYKKAGMSIQFDWLSVQ
jgi:spore coat-associated protein N